MCCTGVDIKRSESMKADVYKKPKRTPSFTTRRRTQSFRKLQKLENVDQLPPVEIQGFLDRKHELQSSGKKAAVRSWKTFYTGEERAKNKNKTITRLKLSNIKLIVLFSVVRSAVMLLQGPGRLCVQ